MTTSMRVGVANWDGMTLEEQRALQMATLRNFLRTQIIPFSPFYRRKFAEWNLDPRSLRTPDDLRRIPFTSKQDLLVSPENPAGPLDFVLKPTAELLRTALPLREKLALFGKRLRLGAGGLKQALVAEYNPASLFFTTGRSTGSVPFFVSLTDQEILLECGRRITSVLALDAEKDRTVSLFPYAPHLAFWQVAYCGMATGVLTLNTGGGRIMPTERLIGAIETMRPTCVAGMPGFFYHLLRRAVEEKRDFSSLRVVTLGGENVAPGFRAKLRETLALVGATDIKVASVLGFTESRSCWAECTGADATGFHTYPDLSLFEIIDPMTGEPLPEGRTGELVYTALAGRGSIVLRYRTGDIIEGGLVESEPCPGCGRRVPRIMSNLQRVSNVKSLEIGKIKGTLVNLNALSQMFAGDRDIEEWQLEIRKRNNDPFDVDEMVLYVALRLGAQREAFNERIQDEVYARSETHLNAVVIEDVPALLTRVGMETLSKEERIVDRRKTAGAKAPEVRR